MHKSRVRTMQVEKLPLDMGCREAPQQEKSLFSWPQRTTCSSLTHTTRNGNKGPGGSTEPVCGMNLTCS